MKHPLVCRDPEIMSGTLVFCGTRVPVQTLLNYIEAGETIDDFLEGFPSVTREQVVAFLRKPRSGFSPLCREDLPRRMRGLAPVPCHRRSRGQDGAPDGWVAIQNGELLALASQAFDIFLTVDRNLSFQQHVAAYPIAVLVLQARTNRLADLMPLVPELLGAIEAAKPGVVQLIGEP